MVAFSYARFPENPLVPPICHQGKTAGDGVDPHIIFSGLELSRQPQFLSYNDQNLQRQVGKLGRCRIAITLKHEVIYKKTRAPYENTSTGNPAKVNWRQVEGVIEFVMRGRR